MGTLEFRILANTKDNADLIRRAQAEPNKTVLKDSKGNLDGWWVPITQGQEKSFPYPEIAIRTRDKGKEKITEVLVVADSYDITGNYLENSTPGTDRQGRPCVNFTFKPQGGKLFGMMTGANLPDEAQGFTRKLGIILDGSLYSAPSIQKHNWRPRRNHGWIHKEGSPKPR